MRHIIRRVGLAVVLASAACSQHAGRADSGQTPPAFVSGTRLRAIILDGGDGAAWFNGWYDSALGTPCFFAPSSDGELRCLPSMVTDAFDPTCTSPIFIPNSATASEVWMDPQSCGAVPTYVSAALGSAVACSQAPLTAFPVQAPFNAAQVGYPNGQGQCDVVQSSNGGFPALRTGAALDPSRLVAGHLEVVPIDQGVLSVRLIRADDGASQIAGILDSASGQDCAAIAFDPVRAGGYLDRCIPTALSATPNVFSDGQCGTPVAAVLTSGCSADAGIALVTPYGNVGCDGGWFSVASLGAALDAGGWSTGVPGDGGFCVPAGPGPQARALGSTLTPDAFASILRANIGTGRLRMTALVNAHGNPLVPLAFFDTLYGTKCEPQAFRDGKVRCLADNLPVLAFFVDPQCSEPVFAQPPPACGEGAPRTYVEYSQGIPGAPYGAGCFIASGGGTLGAPYAPDAAYYATANGCLRYGFNTAASYVTGDAGDPNLLWPEIDSTVL